MLFYSASFADVTWDEQNRVLVTKTKGYMSSEQLRELCAKVIEGIAKFRATKALGDYRAFVTVRPEDQKYVATEWAVQAKKAGLKYTALILPANMIQTQVIDKVTKEASVGETKNFATPEEGMRWLKTKV